MTKFNDVSVKKIPFSIRYEIQSSQEKFEGTKGAIRSCKLKDRQCNGPKKKDRQCNGPKKKDKQQSTKHYNKKLKQSVRKSLKK
jgi:hypothetical protein